jgi:hypothetical protein
MQVYHSTTKAFLYFVFYFLLDEEVFKKLYHTNKNIKVGSKEHKCRLLNSQIKTEKTVKFEENITEIMDTECHLGRSVALDGDEANQNESLRSPSRKLNRRSFLKNDEIKVTVL